MRHRLIAALAIASLALLNATADTTSDKFWGAMARTARDGGIENGGSAD